MLLAATNDGLVGVRRVGGAAGSAIVPDLARSLPVVDPAGRPTRSSSARACATPPGARSGRATSAHRSSGCGGSPAASSPRRSDIRLGLQGEGRCVARPRLCDLRRGIAADDRAGIVTFRLAHRNPSFLRLLTLPFYDLLPGGTPLATTASCRRPGRTGSPPTSPGGGSCSSETACSVHGLAAGRLRRPDRLAPRRAACAAGADVLEGGPTTSCGRATPELPRRPLESTTPSSCTDADTVARVPVPHSSRPVRSPRGPARLNLAIDRREVVRLAGGRWPHAPPARSCRRDSPATGRTARTPSARTRRAPGWGPTSKPPGRSPEVRYGRDEDHRLGPGRAAFRADARYVASVLRSLGYRAGATVVGPRRVLRQRHRPVDRRQDRPRDLVPRLRGQRRDLPADCSSAALPAAPTWGASATWVSTALSAGRASSRPR